ncbi:MAG: NUDIX hydrolase [Terriglobia bacterium]|jgi:ADP-ribose pyrophosphatase YjhB (NUDIX family)
MDARWADWASRLNAIAQNGLTFSRDPFDIERYTSVRNIAAEIMAAHTGVETTLVGDFFAHEEGYATPKVDVRGVVFRDGTLLFVKEPADGTWSLPGGWADVGESPSEAVVREVFEESGYTTHAVKLLALYDRNKHAHPPFPHHAYKLFIRCELLSQVPAGSGETEARFFEEGAIPELSVARVTVEQIARLFEHYRHPEWPADLD